MFLLFSRKTSFSCCSVCDEGDILTAVSVSVSVSAMAVESGGGSDLHLQLFALGGVGRHGVAVVGPEAALALRPHRLRQLIGRV